MKSYGIIYTIKNIINGKIYVGQTIRGLNKRLYQHFNSPQPNSAIDRAIQKYGIENFTFDVVDTADDQETLNMLERLHIARYESMTYQEGYNIRAGGFNGKHSLESRQKLSKSHKGKRLSDEHKKKISNSLKGFKHSKEYKIKLSEVNKGKQYSSKTRKKISDKQSHKGIFGFTGSSYANRRIKPWFRVWKARIGYKNKRKSIGMFEDPLSAQIVYELVKNEIYEGVKI